jgi:hypothetical protein
VQERCGTNRCLLRKAKVFAFPDSIGELPTTRKSVLFDKSRAATLLADTRARARSIHAAALLNDTAHGKTDARLWRHAFNCGGTLLARPYRLRSALT